MMIEKMRNFLIWTEYDMQLHMYVLTISITNFQKDY